MKKTVFFCFAILCILSCGMVQSSAVSGQRRINGEVTEVLSETEALVISKTKGKDRYKSEGVESVDIMVIKTSELPLFKGKKIRGTYVLTGTYDYVTSTGTSLAFDMYVKKRECLSYE